MSLHYVSDDLTAIVLNFEWSIVRVVEYLFFCYNEEPGKPNRDVALRAV
jgi:hypothetical protein